MTDNEYVATRGQIAGLTCCCPPCGSSQGLLHWFQGPIVMYQPHIYPDSFTVMAFLYDATRHLLNQMHVLSY